MLMRLNGICRHNAVVVLDVNDEDDAREMIRQALAVVKRQKKDPENVDNVIEALHKIGYTADLAWMGPYDE